VVALGKNSHPISDPHSSTCDKTDQFRQRLPVPGVRAVAVANAPSVPAPSHQLPNYTPAKVALNLALASALRLGRR
jgi:hypothetical protein